MTFDKETAQYVAAKSKEMLDRQVENYREKRSVTSTIIGLDTLFIPIFLSGILDSQIWVKLIAIVPVALILIALACFVKIYYLTPLEAGLAVDKYEDALNKSYQDALLFEIGVNKDSFKANNESLDKINDSYERGIKFTKIAVIASIIVLILNLTFRPNGSISKVEITKIDTMTTDNKNFKNENNNGGNEPTITVPQNPQPQTQQQPSPDRIVIPQTNPNDREQLKEGIIPSIEKK